MGSIKVGTKVYGEDGKLHSVIGVFPQGVKQVYKVTFSDRTSTECCADHLWTYQYPQDKAVGKWRTSPLAEIMQNNLYKKTNRGDKNWQYFIPIAQPMQFPKRKLLLNPYVLGVLLGDGNLQTTASFTNSETDVVHRLWRRLPSGYELNLQGDSDGHNNNFIITDPYRKSHDDNKVIEALRAYGVFNKGSYDKFIPDDYLFSSVDDRLELLRGLIDTDGCTSDGTMDYSSTSFRLIQGVKFLVQSLGGTATLTVKERPFYVKDGKRVYCHKCYRLYIRLPDLKIACTSEKHMNRLNGVKKNTGVCRSIRRIEYVRDDECQCILVDNPSHLYITNDMIVTHNTQSTIRYINEHPEQKFIYITPYLDEAARIKKGCPHARFVEPSNHLSQFHFRKSEHTADLIKKGRNITTTHQAFKGYTSEMLDDIRNQHYTLFIDENVDVLEEATFHPEDLQIAVNEGYVVENNGIFTLGSKEYHGDAMKGMMSWLKSREIVCTTNESDTRQKLYYWTLPPALILSFDSVYIMTYMFEGQGLHHFLRIYDIPFKYIGVHRTEDGGYCFGDPPGYVPEYVEHIKDKLHILDNPRLNEVGDSRTALSMTWYDKDEDGVQQLKNNVTNYFRNVFGDIPADRRLWGGYKGSYSKVRGKGYTKSFLTFNAKATNEYRDRDCLVYISNIFMNVNEKMFYKAHGIEVDEDAYALSIMVQWIWRSAIRDGGEVNLYIPSSRMRGLLIDWMNQISKEVTSE